MSIEPNEAHDSWQIRDLFVRPFWPELLSVFHFVAPRCDVVFEPSPLFSFYWQWKRTINWRSMYSTRSSDFFCVIAAYVCVGSTRNSLDVRSLLYIVYTWHAHRWRCLIKFSSSLNNRQHPNWYLFLRIEFLNGWIAMKWKRFSSECFFFMVESRKCDRRLDGDAEAKNCFNSYSIRWCSYMLYCYDVYHLKRESYKINRWRFFLGFYVNHERYLRFSLLLMLPFWKSIWQKHTRFHRTCFHSL